MHHHPARLRRMIAGAGLLFLTALAASCKSTEAPAPPGAPATITIVAGNTQQAPAGTPLPAPIVVHVADANGRPVVGQGVEFEVTSGGGELGFTPATDGNGNAQALWTLGVTTATPQRVVARFVDPTTGFPKDPGALFSATATPRGPFQIIQASGAFQAGIEFKPLPVPLVARVVDSYGNAVPNVQVTFGIASGGGSVNPTTAVTGADGTASTTFTLGAAGTQQAARASIPGSAIIFTAISRPGPQGEIVQLNGRPWAIAVSSHDVVYVGLADAASLARFDGSSRTSTRSVAVGATPTEIAFNPAGTTAYVTNQHAQNVGVVNVATNTQTRTIAVTGDPFAIVVSPDGARIYVTTNANNVYAIDPASGAVVGELATGAAANGLALSPDGSKLYVSTRDGNSVLELDASTMNLLRTFNAGTRTQGVLVSPDGTELYVVGEVGVLEFFNLTTGAAEEPLDLHGSGGFGLAMSPDGTKLYVAVMGTSTVVEVNRATHAITRSFYVDGVPRRIAVTSDGTIVVTNEGGYVTWLK